MWFETVNGEKLYDIRHACDVSIQSIKATLYEGKFR